MYYNDHTAPCRPFLTVGTCPGGASSSLTEAISACGNLLKIICKKCAENLEVCEIRIHTVSPRTSRYKLSLNCQCVSESFIPGLNRFFHLSASELPYTAAIFCGERETMPDGDMRSTICTRMSPSCIMSKSEKSKPNI